MAVVGLTVDPKGTPYERRVRAEIEGWRDEKEGVLTKALNVAGLASGTTSRSTLKYYQAFRRIKNFACVEVHNQKVLVFVKVDPTEEVLEPGFTRDVRNIGHYGTGSLEITLKGRADVEKAAPLLSKSYESS